MIPDVPQREVAPMQPDRTWVSDTAPMRTWADRLYLAVALYPQLYSPDVGWVTCRPIHPEVMLNAAVMAIWQQWPRSSHSRSAPGAAQNQPILPTFECATGCGS